MARDNERIRILDLERQILSVLCSVALDSLETDNLRDCVVSKLEGYTWQTPDHRVVFEAFVRNLNRNPGDLRGILRAEATRMGFPDIDWETFFKAEVMSSREIDKILRALARAAKERKL
jgi:hypothetical protein